MALLGAVDLEVHQLDLRYQGLRRRSARKERAVLASLAEIGQQTPVVVVTTTDEQHPILLDGYKRVRALQQLRRDCVVVLMTAAKRRKLDRIGSGR